MSEEIKGKCYQEHEPTPDNPCEIKTMICNDIEIPVEYLKHNFVIVDGKKYIELQQEKQQLEKRINKAIEYIKEHVKLLPDEEGGGLELCDYDVANVLEILRGEINENNKNRKTYKI